jgi:hypothetical protein
MRDHPPDPETRNSHIDRHRVGAKRNRNIEALNSFDNTLPALQVQQLRRRFAMALPFAELVASLHFARAER